MNEELLKAIKSRLEKRSAFNYGILTADRYVKTVQECVGLPMCYRYASKGNTSFDDVMQKAAKTLVYSNEDMIVDQIGYSKSVEGSKRTALVDTKDVDIEPPRNTLMMFRNVLTTPRIDRDGDILRTEGAEIDKSMPLLWQHIPTLPIGKLVQVHEHTPERLSVVSAIIDINPLAHDAAVMVDSGMGRFSHGFRAIEYEPLEAGDDDDKTIVLGFDVKRFEIMEESLVSIPSNIDAQEEEILLAMVEGGKLTSPVMKEYGRTIRTRMPSTVSFTGTIDDFDKIFKGSTTTNLDAQNANTTTDKSKQGKDGKGCSCTSEKEDDKSDTKDTKTNDAKEQEVKRPAILTGSWEWSEKALRQKATAFLAAHGHDLSHRFVWLAGTFSDRAVICSESFEFDAPDEFLYFEASWEMDEGMPAWMGIPQEVTIETTVEIRERSPIFDQKNPPEVDVEKAMAICLASTSKEQRSRMKDALLVFEEVDRQSKRTEELRALLSA